MSRLRHNAVPNVPDAIASREQGITRQAMCVRHESSAGYWPATGVRKIGKDLIRVDVCPVIAPRRSAGDRHVATLPPPTATGLRQSVLAGPRGQKQVPQVPLISSPGGGQAPNGRAWTTFATSASSVGSGATEICRSAVTSAATQVRRFH